MVQIPRTQSYPDSDYTNNSNDEYDGYNDEEEYEPPKRGRGRPPKQTYERQEPERQEQEQYEPEPRAQRRTLQLSRSQSEEPEVSREQLEQIQRIQAEIERLQNDGAYRLELLFVLGKINNNLEELIRRIR
jgi:hypothetical protein